METFKLSASEYNQLQKLTAEKRATHEMISTLRNQLSRSIEEEDKWWAKQAKKHNLTPAEMVYGVNHQTKEIVGQPRPKREQQPEATPQPAMTAVKREPGIAVRPRSASSNAMLSPEEINKMEAARQEASQMMQGVDIEAMKMAREAETKH